MTDEPRRVPRAELVRAAIIADLKDAGEPLPLSRMTRARRVAKDARELHVHADRLVDSGRLTRHGLGYHQGDPYRYELELAPF
mgnify:CR=1 FL=1|jgi:hypothetical protein